MSTLENAISLAVLAHKGQKDKAGQPYILHPLRMMCRMRTEKEMIAAVLHDVIEDTHYALDELRKAGYPLDVIEAVDYLTHRPDENYEAFIERIKGNALAVRVKLADLEDNMDIRRLNGLQEKDKERLQRYQWAWANLTAALDGD